MATIPARLIGVAADGMEGAKRAVDIAKRVTACEDALRFHYGGVHPLSIDLLVVRARIATGQRGLELLMQARDIVKGWGASCTHFAAFIDAAEKKILHISGFQPGDKSKPEGMARTITKKMEAGEREAALSQLKALYEFRKDLLGKNDTLTLKTRFQYLEELVQMDLVAGQRGFEAFAEDLPAGSDRFIDCMIVALDTHLNSSHLSLNLQNLIVRSAADKFRGRTLADLLDGLAKLSASHSLRQVMMELEIVPGETSEMVFNRLPPAMLLDLVPWAVALSSKYLANAKVSSRLPRTHSVVALIVI